MRFSLLAVVLLVPPALPDPQPYQVHDFATLCPVVANRLQGVRARFLIDLDSEPETIGHFTAYDCVTADNRERSVFLVDGEPDKDRVVVEGRLRIVDVPAAPGFAAFTEYRLLDARQTKE